MRLLCEKLEQVGLEFPCNEPSLYGVICELRRLGAPVSRSKGILESIAFVRYTMGVLECDALLKGRRCWGASTSDEPLHRNQASPLSVEELRNFMRCLNMARMRGTGCLQEPLCSLFMPGLDGVMHSILQNFRLTKTVRKFVLLKLSLDFTRR